MVYTSTSLASVAISLLALSEATAVSTSISSSFSTSTTSSLTDWAAFPTSTSPTCPKADNNVFIAKSGATFLIECGIDYAGGDLKMVNIASNRIADCVNACDATEGCIDISMSGTACYMKKKLGKPLSNKIIRGARKIKDAPTSSSSSSYSTSISSSQSSSYSASHSVTQAPTFSIPTASTAPSTASLPTVDQGTEYVNYTNVGGYFLQDLDTTVPSTFDYTATNFGLINQTYETDSSSDGALTQWQRFNNLLKHMNSEAPKNVEYKLLFIGRHGEGYHNAAQTYYGTPAWNCYWSQQTGNSTNSWQDADLTPAGTAQALKANKFWSQQLLSQKIQPPQSFYVSPLTRCLKTANLTFSGLSAISNFIPTIKEYIREGISTHTCDHRSNATYIHDLFPTWNFEPTFTETDEFWNGITEESSSAQDYRSKLALDDIFSTDAASVISITTHSGETSSLLRVLKHRSFSLVTGAVIPVFVKAETIKVVGGAVTTTVPWDAGAWCTNGPPLASSTACVCSDGVVPVATTASSA
ncbi:phosphoglycerate mutase-like protein [Aureobasidium subglaciale]|nr:phosphoglycerate mutase-like protein [Aureobasidium subglaciale]